MEPQNYPAHWPRPNPRNPDSLASRISEEDKVALYNRETTGRALSRKYGVTEKWLSSKFHGRKPVVPKNLRLKAIRQFRLFHAKQVIDGLTTTRQAAAAAFTSYSTMRRTVMKLRHTVQEV